MLGGKHDLSQSLMKIPSSVCFAFALTICSSHAGWGDLLGRARNLATNEARGVAPASNTGGSSLLSQDQVVQGLKEALGKGVEEAIGQLGHAGGFLTNQSVKIPMPERLQTIEKTLRTLKQEKLADDFVATMNHAAEQAVPEGVSVFGEAIKGMSIEDARGILTGPNDAATQYFRKATQSSLHDKFLPIVKIATDKAGVTAAYKKLVAAGSTTSMLGSFGASVFDPASLDVDAYVTGKALDGLFVMIAAEEQRIRSNPVARTTDLLQKVFGAIGK